MKKLVVIVMVLGCAMAGLACADEDEPRGAKPGVDAGGGGDAGADGDADADGDGDTDSDTDSDSDADGDAGADGDTDSDSDGDAVEVEITAPDHGDEFEEGTPVTFEATVTSVDPAPDELTATWSSDVDGELGTATPEAGGSVSLTTSDLTTGYHVITLELDDGQGVVGSDTLLVGICAWGDPETFDADLGGTSWQIYGDAYWDAGGWLEMTGDLQNMQGAIFNVAERITPGDVSISFLIATGPNTDTGADGFAMSVINADDVTHLEEIIAAGREGGGLGYAVSGGYGSMVIEAFHIEIDTWQNIFNGDTELHSDPTEQTHIGVTLNGDPGEHYLWAEMPSIEDLVWREVMVEVEGTNVRVTVDGEVKMDDLLDGWAGFRGGYIGFTGTTGFYTNYHRFDELRILQECMVPE